jgi:hypothetical protein
VCQQLFATNRSGSRNYRKGSTLLFRQSPMKVRNMTKAKKNTGKLFFLCIYSVNPESHGQDI